MPTSATGGDAGDSVLRHDLRRGLTTARRFAPDKGVGEFVFVPTATHAIEDDGVLMGFVYDVATGRSDLVILDAATLETIVAIHLPTASLSAFTATGIPAAP
jgi:carotenoid cleavage dioxygenase